MKQQGVVKWFRDDKGFGFLVGQTGEEHFVHFSSIVGTGHRSLIQGQHVEFESVNGPKGLAAKAVRVIEEGAQYQ